MRQGVFLVFFFSGCATVPVFLSGDIDSPRMPDLIIETTPADWGANALPAKLYESDSGYSDFIRIEVAYGESVIVWSFNGLRREKSYSIQVPLIIDARDNDTWVEIGTVPGLISADDCYWPRESIREGIAAKWDPHGGGADNGHGNSTGGIYNLILQDRMTDENGSISLIMVTGHWTKVPEITCQYIGNISLVPN